MCLRSRLLRRIGATVTGRRLAGLAGRAWPTTGIAFAPSGLRVVVAGIVVVAAVL